MPQNERDPLLDEYLKLAGEHDELARRYAGLEKRETEIRENEKLSTEEKLRLLGPVMEGFEEVAKAMEDLAKRAKELSRKMGNPEP